MINMKLGVQTYTIRELVKNNLRKTLQDLKDLGIQNIELAYIPLTEQNIIVIKNSKIKVLSLQLKLKILKKDFDTIVKHCNDLKCRRVVVSVMPLYAILGGRRAIIKLSKELNHLKDQYKKEHIEFAYHHHDFEFKKIKNKTKLDILLEHIDMDVKMVTDTYWAAKSNVNPADLINSLKNRIMGVHLRDLRTPHDAEVGQGIIDFKEVLFEAKKYASYAVIEQNTKQPFESLKLSTDYIKEHFQNLFEQVDK